MGQGCACLRAGRTRDSPVPLRRRINPPATPVPAAASESSRLPAQAR
ncbi:MAG: hypothetical protein HC911_15150 [Chloroflexaceae bacterium]|nr:hypothetical protein [Chloroflexaceae bacterium]